MDDDFDLPDEGPEGRSSKFVNSLFGAAKVPSATTNRSAFNDILAGAPRRRQPFVTFQDEKEETDVPSASSHNQTESHQQVQSSALLDSLFSSPTPGEEQRRKSSTNPMTSSTSGSNSRSTPATTTRQSHQQQLATSSVNRVSQQRSSSPPQAARGGVAAMIDTSAVTSLTSANVLLLQAELEQLRREVSNLRFEHSEDQKTIAELRRRLDIALEDHQKTTNRLTEQHSLEINELERRHERAMDEAKREGDKGTQILSNIREQEGFFANLTTRMDTLNFTFDQLREKVHSVVGRGEEMEANLNTFTADLRSTLNTQQSEQWKRFDTDRQQWEKAVKDMEMDFEKMREQHTKEIVEGRYWLEEQRELINAERKAFQEQSLILDWIEHKKAEIESNKNEFLCREHNLLVRVVNERALLEHERREFVRQRDADVMRLREEAEQLEQSLAQIENTRNALLNARRDLERKSEQLNELRNALTRAEQRLHWHNKGFALEK